MNTLNKFWIVLTGVVCLLIYFIPYFVLGEGASIRVFDNLDGEILYKIFASKKSYWLNYQTIIPEIMNGLPRFCMTSGLNYTTLLFALFPPFIAYLVNDFTVRLIGFVGMYALLSKHIIQIMRQKINIIALLISCTYVFIPFFTIYGLTELGQPLVLFAFFNLLKGEKSILNYVWIFLFPFFSSFVLSGFFVGVALGVIWLITCIRRRQFLHRPLFVVLIYAVICFIVEYNLIIPILQGFHSHREETAFGKSDGNLLLYSLKYLWETGIYSQFYTLPIWLTVIFAFILNKGKRKTMGKTLFYFAVIFILIMLFEYYCPSIKGFRLSRFYHLLPICWMLLFAVAFQILRQQGRKAALLGYAVLSVQIAFLLFRSYNYCSGNKIRDSLGFQSSYHYPSFSAFYAKPLLNEVSDFIGKEKSEYRVLNIGILPAVTQYNGFYTLDSYQNNYPLEYKHLFKKIIDRELEKSPAKGIFDNFGNWCYVFPGEVHPVEIIRGEYAKNRVLYDLELNVSALKTIGCDYIFSSAEIKNCERSGLKFLKSFKNDDSHWDVWLYEVDVF
ncbi:MAG: DUF6044 family protein [Dysgonamonadaceae bacterium]|nr:DUF6044 family protein [Dysgonamonadaceae bacterium]